MAPRFATRTFLIIPTSAYTLYVAHILRVIGSAVRLRPGIRCIRAMPQQTPPDPACGLPPCACLVGQQHLSPAISAAAVAAAETPGAYASWPDHDGQRALATVEPRCSLADQPATGFPAVAQAGLQAGQASTVTSNRAGHTVLCRSANPNCRLAIYNVNAESVRRW